jgi:hypothetical protein
MNRTALGIAALLTVGLSSLAHAQTGGNLPLVAVADGYNWIQSAEEYRIVVTAANAGRPLNLEVYSPGLNTADYVGGKASAGYFGDELYSKAQPFSTTFTLTGPGGKVFERPYSTVPGHTWERLLGSTLAAGTYTLRVVSSGLGKNAYALRVAQPFVLESSSFTINARGEGDLLAARLRIGQEYLGKNLELLNYDGDGVGELELFAPRRQANPTADLGQRALGGDSFSHYSSPVGRLESGGSHFAHHQAGKQRLYLPALERTRPHLR